MTDEELLDIRRRTIDAELVAPGSIYGKDRLALLNEIDRLKRETVKVSIRPTLDNFALIGRIGVIHALITAADEVRTMKRKDADAELPSHPLCIRVRLLEEQVQALCDQLREDIQNFAI